MAKVLITGIAGFIGSSLARALLAQGASVRGIDDLSTGHWENIEEIAGKIELIEASVENIDAVSRGCDGIDYVFHQAAIPSVTVSVSDPLGTNGPNLVGTLTLLEAARHAGVKRLMYAASSAAYGDKPELPKTEAMLPAPISPYAVQKVTGEYYLASYARLYGLETVALRYFNIFGPRQDPTSHYSGVLARFIAQMCAGETPTIFGDGQTSRDFTFIDNVVSANLLAAKASSAVSGMVFNIATGQRITLLDAYQTIRDMVGYKGSVCFMPEREGDIKHSVANIALAKEMIGYRVVADFVCGLKQTMAWNKQRAMHAHPYSPALQAYGQASEFGSQLGRVP